MANCFPKLWSFLSDGTTIHVSISDCCGAMDVEERPQVLGTHIRVIYVATGWLPTSAAELPGASM